MAGRLRACVRGAVVEAAAAARPAGAWNRAVARRDRTVARVRRCVGHSACRWQQNFSRNVVLLRQVPAARCQAGLEGRGCGGQPALKTCGAPGAPTGSAAC
eukprot:363630-Chlamydomonas_euryale.AAC.1